jgi:DNA repair protein RecO (recombination protein O)
MTFRPSCRASSPPQRRRCPRGHTPRAPRLATRRVTTPALVVRFVSYGEADAIVTLFTEALGKVSALARGVRRGARRLAGALEPMHLLSVAMDERPGAELLALREASITRVRTHLTQDLAKMEAAGQAMRWVRAGSPPRTPEPEVWAELEALLGRLDDRNDELLPATHLAASGLRLLRAFGYGLELTACIRCGRRCDPERSAYVDSAAGGLVCQACGGGHKATHHLLDAAVRKRLAAAAAGKDAALVPEDTAVASRLVTEALAAHAGVEK